jgi:trehalose 6-phosphate phosphatase
VSGRPAAFLLAHLGDRGLFLAGMYGLEVVPDDGGEVRVVPEAEPWRAAVEQAVAAAVGELPAGVEVEGKGLSLTVHYRAEPAQEDAVGSWVAAQAEATGLVVHQARMSYELRPPVERDKGAVVAEAAEGRRQVCFLGDDRGDLSAFDALDRLAARGATVLRVGVSSPEAPTDLLDRADLVVDGPQGALGVLRALLDAG